MFVKTKKIFNEKTGISYGKQLEEDLENRNLTEFCNKQNNVSGKLKGLLKKGNYLLK